MRKSASGAVLVIALRGFGVARVVRSFWDHFLKMWRPRHSDQKRRAPWAGVAAGSRTPVLALGLASQDRAVLQEVCRQRNLELHFADSREEARSANDVLIAPVILYDRDWPHEDWRTVVRDFAGCSHGACVVLLSRVVDDYLRQELIRRGGYDLLVKPVRADDAGRMVNLALSYWRSTARMIVGASKL